MGRLATVARIGVGPVKRHDYFPAAAFLGPASVPLIGQEMLHRGQKERAEIAFLTINVRQPILHQQPGEELLGQVLASWVS